MGEDRGDPFQQDDTEFMVTIDYYSSFFEIYRLTNKTEE